MKTCGGIFDVAGLAARLDKLDQQTTEPGFWDDQDKAKEVNRKRAGVQATLKPVGDTARALDDAEAMFELASELGDESMVGEVEELVSAAKKGVEDLEFRRMLSGPHDSSNAIVEINSGAGGTESCDWASMLLRMYLRYCERRGYKTEIIDQQDGDEAGIKSATFTVEGPYAYGYLRPESGVHRLVRISPYDSNARRHTSFASVSVTADIEEDIKIDIDEADLRVDTYRSSGAGGQKVNKTDSAVRLTHIPTGLVVACQNERSQHKNRSMAMKILKARLFQLEERKRDEEKAKLEGAKKDIGWGSQIRSYVLQPYRMVKDLRTRYTVGNVDAVLDGDIEGFVIDYLMKAGSGQLLDGEGEDLE